MDLGVTDKVKPLIDKVRQMVSDDIEPLDHEFHGCDVKGRALPGGPGGGLHCRGRRGGAALAEASDLEGREPLDLLHAAK